MRFCWAWIRALSRFPASLRDPLGCFTEVRRGCAKKGVLSGGVSNFCSVWSLRSTPRASADCDESRLFLRMSNGYCSSLNIRLAASVKPEHECRIATATAL